MKEACGIFGIWAPGKEVARTTFFGLFLLQHRGQESSGISVTDFQNIITYKKMGLVSQVFNEEIINSLQGQAAIGHNRYGTTGSSCVENAQPYQFETNLGPMALAHNGNLANTKTLKKILLENGHGFTSSSDSEVIARIISSSKGNTWAEKISAGVKKLRGAFSLLILTPKSIFAIRDPWGIRPLVIGKYNNSGYVVASESCALNHIDAPLIREILPGEIVQINNKGIKSISLNNQKKKAFCIFEYIYFSRPDSVLNGVSVYSARFKAGRILAKKYPVKADFVISVPDSGTTAAVGYANYSKIPFMEGLIKNRYIGRTFIQPGDKLRKLGVRLKFSPVVEQMKGKSIIVVDDSIVRGNTLRDLIKVLKKTGIAQVHLRIASPPLISPCFLGVDIEQHKELVACNKTVEEIKKEIGADSLAYLSLEDLQQAIGKVNTQFCTGCFTAKYPLDLEK